MPPSPSTIVLVDDHEALREALAATLRFHGFDVVGQAGSMAAGEDLIRVTRPQMALLDIQLPDGSGIDLTRAVLELDPDLLVVLYTGVADAELLYDGLDSGARGYVLKAGSTDELVEAIRRVADGLAYVDPRLDRILLSPRVTERVTMLSPREREIMNLMAEGLTAEAIANQLVVSIETVRTHVRNVIRKLQARNRVHAIAIALERGEIALGDGTAER